MRIKHMSEKNNMKLFALNSNQEIAQKISEVAGIPLGKLSSRQFSDGEIQINIEESVRGYDIYIIQSTSYPVNNHLMELLIMVDACQRASAHTVNVVLPYFGYALSRPHCCSSRTNYSKIGCQHACQGRGRPCCNP